MIRFATVSGTAAVQESAPVLSELLCDTTAGDGMSVLPDRPWPSSSGLAGEAEEPAAFDLRRTVDDAAADLARCGGEKGLTIQVRYALAAPRFLIGHRDRISQVMRRLVGHAGTLAAGLEPAGRVVVDVQGDECGDGCAVMRLRVEVAGPGVAAEEQPGITALADCRRLVELMGGRLGAITDPGNGSFVWLALKLPVDAARGSRA